ncbi:MAG: hypothetical protein JWN98_1970 [Abditibacteriota bacterium]|nr:hypothetical protein [Abditibacteriota bacterium]
MKRLLLLSGLLACKTALAQVTTPVIVQDFEKVPVLPKVWGVGVPNEYASVKLAANRSLQGKHSLNLHYRFTGPNQYFGVTTAVRILAPIHKLHWMLYGDASNSGQSLYVIDSKGETHKYRNPATAKIDFKGWKEFTVDINAPHETWGGDKNGKIDYPITALTFEVNQGGTLPVESDLYFDAVRVDSEKSAVETVGAQVSVVSPAYGADIKGNTRVVLSAPDFKRLTVFSWKPGGAYGYRSTVATINLDSKGNGSFVFPADVFPHGPITVTITGETGTYKDNCYLQLYNKGGISWKEGLPEAPPAAKGMTLVFADDFNGPLSISGSDSKAQYYSHKPPNGSQDFSSLPFSDYESPKNPFFQVDSYLRIRADEKKNSSGLLSSVHNDASGIKASLPAYFECRFLGPNAIGTWPAFWLMTDYMPQRNAGKPDSDVPVDELDIIEAYGGEGPGSPNAYDTYQIAVHAWNQGEAGKAAESAARKAVNSPVHMKKFGIPSTWYEAFHTYGCKITETDTIYYCDNIEVARHKTLEISKKHPFFFMINLATGGGWPVDLSRYDGQADMYVDYVRVYQGK